MKGFGNMMKQLRKVQEKMNKTQEELATRTVEGTAGGSMVTAVVNGKQELVSLKIEKEVVDPEDVEMLQDLIVAAVNQAIKKSQDMMNEEMSKITGGLGLNLPGMF
jgi:DNA-binding YbaB/EbfC family protein